MSTTPDYPMPRRCPFAPAPDLERLRDERPVGRVRIWDGATPWLVTRYDDVRAVLTDPRAGADGTLPGHPHVSPGSKARRGTLPDLMSLDAPEHSRLRRVVAADFTVRRIQRLQPMVTEVVDDALDRMVTAGPPCDLVDVFALPVPSAVISRMLGVPDREHAFFQECSRRMLDTEDVTGATALTAGHRLQDYLTGLVERRASAPADDLLGRLGAALADGTMNRDEAGTMALLLLLAGHDTTANMIALATARLLTEPDLARRIRDGDPDEIAHAVEELLRALAIVQVGRRRTALADIEIGGTTIPAGDGIVVDLDSANHDPAAFGGPGGLDPDRTPNHHVAFGYGVHHCLGAHLARLELRVALPALLRRFPGLALGRPVGELAFRDPHTVVYGLHELPVTW